MVQLVEVQKLRKPRGRTIQGFRLRSSPRGSHIGPRDLGFRVQGFRV